MITLCNLIQIKLFWRLNLLSYFIFFPSFWLFVMEKFSFLRIWLSLHYEKLWNFSVKIHPCGECWLQRIRLSIPSLIFPTAYCTIWVTRVSSNNKQITHEIVTNVSKETGPILVTRVLCKEISYTDKKLSSFRPKKR